ncbi:MAG: HYR domain-containing protein, partial [Bacteroidales bacterium]|nr:HYR domain-containing protein [Bacteroidales bacterium]
DNCGNTATASQTINVVDNTPPAITCPPDITQATDPGLQTATVAVGTATADDNCSDPVTIAGVRSDGLPLTDPYPLGTTTITWTATDDCGNASSCEQTITVTPSCIEIEAYVYLEGALADPEGTATWTTPMRTDLNDLRILPGQTLVDMFTGNYYTPAGQPYSIAPWLYPGGEGALYDSGGDPSMADAGYPATVVDWVLVSLRTDPEGTGGPVCQKAALLHSDGHIEFVTGFDCCDLDLTGTYYLVIEHRNHLIVMSPEPLPIVGGKITYDFRSTQSYIFNSGFDVSVGQKEVLPGVFAMYAGNGNQTATSSSDTDINFDDRTYWEGQNGTIGRYRNGDYNLNGDTNYNDRTLWEFNNGRFTSVPR